MVSSPFLYNEVVEFPSQCLVSGATGFSPVGETGEGFDGLMKNGLADLMSTRPFSYVTKDFD